MLFTAHPVLLCDTPPLEIQPYSQSYSHSIKHQSSPLLRLSSSLLPYFVFVDVTLAEESRLTSFLVLGWRAIKTKTNKNKPVFTK